MKKNQIIKMENKLNKYDKMMHNNSIKSYLPSGYLFSSDELSKYILFFELEFLKI
jgi:hypothetical protein